MTPSLARWIADADALRHLEQFGVRQATVDYAHIRDRRGDYYVSLTGELFARMRLQNADPAEWARIGNAFAQLSAADRDLAGSGVSRGEATLFASTAFYCGGFPASAYLTIKGLHAPESETYRACFDMLGRPRTLTSPTGKALLKALRDGDMGALADMAHAVSDAASAALGVGPSEWIPARLLDQVMERFIQTNVRAVLPDGASPTWNPLIASFLDRTPPSWEFFPSQIQAIHSGLLERRDTFSLQMPTGAGKTALCETLLYWHSLQNPGQTAVLLVPYRSLASELRSTVVKRLNAMGISARCAYGGTVPTGDEVRGLDETRVIVATPEALSGLLSADAAFMRRITLMICDEGHLLDSGARGVGLELLLARMRARDGGAPRFVFVSAIVPNIEEIHAWLNGPADSVVRSDYRPALAEFAMLQPRGAGAATTVALVMHPHEPPPTRFAISDFLARRDFLWLNPETGRLNTYGFEAMKVQAIAAARKALNMGAVAVFAANKRGDQGAVGLAQELLEQLAVGLPLPKPVDFASRPELDRAAWYVAAEYGDTWVGTQALAAGAVLHHGDIPQETREVVEGLLRSGHIRLAICTNTLAEGVNLPIRTLVLYSVRRRTKAGVAADLLTRDIKNLAGRAGRAGSTTKGLVICVNPQQWPLVARVARQSAGERVTGFLLELIEGLERRLAVRNQALTNQMLEVEPDLHALVDGVDATLIDLAAEEVGEEALIQVAMQVADQTFAATQAATDTQLLLREVFHLRASRFIGIRNAGRLGWLRETGARARLLDLVEHQLLPRRTSWDDVLDPVDPAVVHILLEWAWFQRETQQAVRDALRLPDETDVNDAKGMFFDLVSLWLAGRRFVHIAASLGRTIDDVLALYTSAIAFVLQTLVEQGIALLAKFLESEGRVLSEAIQALPEHLRFGVPTPSALLLASLGVRHRRAAVDLGGRPEVAGASDRAETFLAARDVLLGQRDEWTTYLGSLVFDNTLEDLSWVIGDGVPAE